MMRQVQGTPEPFRIDACRESFAPT